MWAGKTKNGYQDFTIFIISPKSKQEPELFNTRNLLDLSFKWYCLRNFVPYTRHCITSVTVKSYYSLSFSLFLFFSGHYGNSFECPAYSPLCSLHPSHAHNQRRQRWAEKMMIISAYFRRCYSVNCFHRELGGGFWCDEGLPISVSVS